MTSASAQLRSLIHSITGNTLVANIAFDAIMENSELLADLAVEFGGLVKSWCIPMPGEDAVTFYPNTPAPKGSVQHFVKKSDVNKAKPAREIIASFCADTVHDEWVQADSILKALSDQGWRIARIRPFNPDDDPTCPMTIIEEATP